MSSECSSLDCSWLSEIINVQTVKKFDWGQLFLAVCAAAETYYTDPTRLSSDKHAAATLSYSQSALCFLLDRFFTDSLRCRYLDLRRTVDLDQRRRVISQNGEPPRKICRFKTGTGCSAAYVADLPLLVNTYVTHLFANEHLSYSTLASDGCIQVDVFMDCKSHGFLGMSSKVTTCSLHFPQVRSPQSHIAWLPYAIMIGKDDEINLTNLYSTLAFGERVSLKQRLLALKDLRVRLSNLSLPVRLLLTGDYACMRSLFSASRSNYINCLPKETSNIWNNDRKRAASEYFSSTPSVWCNTTPALLNAGFPCEPALSNAVWDSSCGLTTDEAFPGLLHLCVLGVAGAIADAGRALKKLLSTFPAVDEPMTAVLQKLRQLFRDNSGNSLLAWDIFNEEKHPASNYSKSHHRPDHTNVLAVLRDPSPVLQIVQSIAANEEVMTTTIGRFITCAIINAMDVALCVYGKPSLHGCHDSVATLLRKGQSLDTQWVELCAYHAPTSGIVAQSGLPGTRFLPPYTAHNIAAHLFCQHAADALRVLHTRSPVRNRSAHWEFGGEHLNNLIASLSCDAKVFSASFCKRAMRILRIAILNCLRRCIAADGAREHREFVNCSYVVADY